MRPLPALPVISPDEDLPVCSTDSATDFATWSRMHLDGVETALDALLPTSAGPLARLAEAMRYAALSGGKRVRALLVAAAGERAGAPRERLWQVGAAVEMVHAYSLVHDDLPCMDDDALRRGKPTVHVQYDEPTALLVGDGLQARAFEVLADPQLGPDGLRQLAMVRVLGEAAGARGMVGGQAIDIDHVGLPMTAETLEDMHRRKTGALIRASIELGALCGAVTVAEREALQRFGQAVGLAFQVVDDILDVTASTASLGKTAGKDAQANKPTYVSLLGLPAARERARCLAAEADRALEALGGATGRLRQLAGLIVERRS